MFKNDVRNLIDKKVPDARQLQIKYCNVNKSDMNGPDEILYDIRDLLDKYFPEEKYKNVFVKNYSGTIHIPREDIPLRIVMGNFALNEVVEKINSN